MAESKMVSAEGSGPKRVDRRSLVKIIVALVAGALIVVPVVMLNVPRNEEKRAVISFSGGKMSGGFYLTAISQTTIVRGWDNITIFLSDGSEWIAWNNISRSDLTSSGQPRTWHFGFAKQLGPYNVWLNVSDVIGDGRLGPGDTLNFTTGGTHFNETRGLMFDLIDKPSSQIIFDVQVIPGLGPVYMPNGLQPDFPGPDPLYEMAIVVGIVLLGLLATLTIVRGRRAAVPPPPPRPPAT